MKSYADLYAESPRAFLRKLEDDFKSLEGRLARLDRLAVDGVGNLLAEYERLSLLVEQKAYGVEFEDSWHWRPQAGSGVANIYAPETLADGRSYCWTGPDTLTQFALPVRRDQPLHLRVNFMKTLEAQMLDSLELLVDGERIKHHSTGGHILATIPPRITLTAAPTLLAINTGPTAAPGQDDARKLGIALFAIDAGAGAGAAALEVVHG